MSTKRRIWPVNSAQRASHPYRGRDRLLDKVFTSFHFRFKISDCRFQIDTHYWQCSANSFVFGLWSNHPILNQQITHLQSSIYNQKFPCTYPFLSIKSIAFASVLAWFPGNWFCEKKCLQISLLRVILPLTLLKIVQGQASQSIFSPPFTGWRSAVSWARAERGVLKGASSLSLLCMRLTGIAKRKQAVSCTGCVTRRGSPAVA
jgi:hypothetical protein